ncbi:MAG: hypothetical protein KDB65_11520 [Calditrichaeota bacterium]|nr:hypothetical protein [Calditrichota bacterium]MCB9367863.1 hypothetical protein [Calditrichota bacterium]
MNRFVAAILCILVLLNIGCDTDSDSSETFHPAEPTLNMLESGPGNGAEFFWWSDSGRSRAAAANYRAAEWVTDTATTHIQIECMVGLFVYPGCLGSQPDLECDIVVADPTFAQLEYGPTGLSFQDSVKLWIDSTVVDFPVGTYAADVAFYYYNPESGEFEQLDTWINDHNGWIEAKVTHFSRYILGRKVTQRN